MTQWYSRWRVLVLAFALVAIGVGAVVASQMFNPDSIPQVLAQDDNGNGTRTHEGCSIGPIFDYSASLSELEFGAVVNCTSNTMLYIRIDAYLYKMDTDDEWVHIRTANKACYVSRNCTADRTIDNPADGDYQLMYCFNAYSIGSSWSYTCFYGEYEIP